MTKLHTIEPNGQVDSVDYAGDLEYSCVLFKVLKTIIGCADVEHVSVLWKGKPAHMFVNENGLAMGLRANWRATGVYSNVMARRDGQPQYNDLEKDPPFTMDQYHYKGFLIVGTACLWEGDME